MHKSGRVAVVLGLFLVAVGFMVWAIVVFTAEPPTVDYTAGHVAGRPVNVTLQTVGSYGSGTEPTWVSYLTRSPQGQWVHTTLWQVPAHTRINVTVYQYDSGSPLRNQQLGQVTGTIGNVALLNGRPFRVINSNAGNGVGHTFSIPTLGISVPLYGNSSSANLCAAAPCTFKSPHQIVRFSFISPGAGNYPWQCFIPCGLAFLNGNGGPMQTIGYMSGFMKVT